MRDITEKDNISFEDAVIEITNYVHERKENLYTPVFYILDTHHKNDKLSDDAKTIFMVLEKKSYRKFNYEKSYEIGSISENGTYFYNLESSIENFINYVEEQKDDKNYKLDIFLNTPQFLAYKPFLMVFFITMYISFILYAVLNKNVFQVVLYSVFIHGLVFVPAYEIHNKENSGSFGVMFPLWTIIVNWVFVLSFITYLVLDYYKFRF